MLARRSVDRFGQSATWGAGASAGTRLSSLSRPERTRGCPSRAGPRLSGKRHRRAPGATGRLPTVVGGVALGSRRGRDAAEIRVLGCLLEKQRTTPDQYPLSLNALRLACNQSTSRDPVVEYDEPTIRIALEALSRRGWVRLASGAGSRAVKYRHLLDEALVARRRRALAPRPADAARAADRGRAPAANRTAAPLRTRRSRRGALRLTEREYVGRHPNRPGERGERYTSCSARSSRGRAHRTGSNRGHRPRRPRQPARRRGRAPLGRARAIASPRPRRAARRRRPREHRRPRRPPARRSRSISPLGTALADELLDQHQILRFMLQKR